MDVPGWRVLGINAQLLGSDLEQAVEQEAMIAEAATTLHARRLALFLHKPMFDRDPGEAAITGASSIPHRAGNWWRPWAVWRRR